MNCWDFKRCGCRRDYLRFYPGPRRRHQRHPGARAHMIPMHIAIDSPEGKRAVNVQILDLPLLTPQAMEVVLYDALLQSNDSSSDSSYHLTGSIDLEGHAPSPVDEWGAPNHSMAAPMLAALLTGEHFTRLYENGARQGTVQAIDLHVEAVPRRMQVELEGARLISSNIAHAGETIQVEATVRPWHRCAEHPHSHHVAGQTGRGQFAPAR